MVDLRFFRFFFFPEIFEPPQTHAARISESTVMAPLATDESL